MEIADCQIKASAAETELTNLRNMLVCIACSNLLSKVLVINVYVRVAVGPTVDNHLFCVIIMRSSRDKIPQPQVFYAHF